VPALDRLLQRLDAEDGAELPPEGGMVGDPAPELELDLVPGLVGADAVDGSERVPDVGRGPAERGRLPLAAEADPPAGQGQAFVEVDGEHGLVGQPGPPRRPAAAGAPAEGDAPRL